MKKGSVAPNVAPIVAPNVAPNVAPIVPPDSRLLRLSEILLRANPLLRVIKSPDFNEFVERYSEGVTEGVQLLRWFFAHFPPNTAHNTRTYSWVLSHYTFSNECHHIALDDKLSLIHQLEQILARWTVSNWVCRNKKGIKWLYRRHEFYPLILTQLALTDFPVGEKEVTLPSIKIDWLIDMVYPLLWARPFEAALAAALCQRQHHSQLLSFAAQLDRIELMMAVIEDLITKKMTETLNFVLYNAAFFAELIGVRKVIRPAYAAYVQANSEATALLSQITQYKDKLYELFQDGNRHSILESIEKLEYFAPLLRILIAGVLNKRLPMLVELSKISNAHPEHCKRAVKVLIWLENYREIIKLSINPESEWNHWLDAQRAHQPAIKAFSEGLLELLDGFELKLISELPEDQHPLQGKIYIEKVGTKLRYVMNTPAGKKIDSFLKINIRCKTALTTELLRGYSSAILGKIAKRGQTLLDPSNDVRPSKAGGGESETFPSANACFMDCLAGLAPEDRSNDLGSLGADVLLYQFMFDPRNAAIVNHIEQHRPSVTPIFDAYLAEQAQVDQQMMALAVSVEPVDEPMSPPREHIMRPQTQPSPVQRVARKPRNLTPAFHEAVEEREQASVKLGFN